MSTVRTGQLYNFIQGSDITGESAYDIWKRLGNTGTEADFLEYIRSGPSGEPAYSYILETSDLVIKKTAQNVLLPACITFRSFYREGTNADRTEYLGRFIIEESFDGTVWETKYTSTEDESSKEYTPSSCDVRIIKCTLYAEGGTTTALDNQSVLVLADVDNLKIGARNILSQSDFRHVITKDSSAIIDTIHVVDNYDLQQLVGESIAVSCYANSIGEYTNSDDGFQTTSNKFGMYAVLTWADSTGTKTTKQIQNPIDLNLLGIERKRVGTTYQVVAPEGYDTLEDLYFDIVLTLKPSGDNEWVFERPKLEIGTTFTEWIIASEDIPTFNVVLSNEIHVVSADKDGFVGAISDCYTQVQVISGEKDVTDKASYEAVPCTSIIGYWDPSTYTYHVEDLTADNGYVDILVTYHNVTVPKRFSISKTKAGTEGPAGQSTYDIWKGLGNEGDAYDFIEYLKGEQGPAGQSTYDIWKSLGNEGTPQDFIEFLRGSDREQGPQGPQGEQGEQGPAGDSAYQIWLNAGNTGTEADFLNSLKGEKGDAGISENTTQIPIKAADTGELYIIQILDGKLVFDKAENINTEG